MHDDSIALVPLTQGKFAIIDDADADRVLAFKWYFANGYAKNGTVGYMHRFINGTPAGRQTDHINHDRLDNRRANLETVSDSLSVHRRKPYGKSGFRGVRVNPKGGAFESRIRKDGVEQFLGAYLTVEEAAVAYNAKAIELYGDSALLNDVDASIIPLRLKRWRNNVGGERHGMSKLTAEDIQDIRKRKASSARGIGVQLAREYGISYTHLKRILSGKAWQ